MKKLVKLFVNNYDSREKICSGLIEAGYVVEVKTRPRPSEYLSKDYYIIVYKNPNKKEA